MNNKANKNRSKHISWISYVLVIAITSGITLFAANTFNKPEPVQQTSSTAKKADEKTAEEKKEPTAGESEDITFSDNWFMDTRINFVLDGIWQQMGSMQEILDTVKNIRHTSELSWFREWNKTAERLQAVGDSSLEKNHNISAGETYLRASNYYLAAEVFLHTNPEDPRILETYKKGADLFLKGLRLLSVPVEEVRIPYEGTTLKGYFFKTNSEKAPTLLVHQGFDAPVEQTKYIADAAIRRGYNCLLFEGPGQGLSIREKGLALRPDWEKAVTPVVNYVCTRPDVDRDNIILMGISMGGGFAVRAAAYEPRIRICVVNPGYINCYSIIKDMLTPKFINLYEQDAEEFNKKFLELTKYDVGLRWGIYHGMWVFGGKTPSDFLTKVRQYDYTNDLSKIKCQMLIMDGTKETWGAGQAKALYDALDCPRDYILFTEEDSAATHCQTGNPAISAQRMFDWLDEHISR